MELIWNILKLKFFPFVIFSTAIFTFSALIETEKSFCLFKIQPTTLGKKHNGNKQHKMLFFKPVYMRFYSTELLNSSNRNNLLPFWWEIYFLIIWWNVKYNTQNWHNIKRIKYCATKHIETNVNKKYLTLYNEPNEVNIKNLTYLKKNDIQQRFVIIMWTLFKNSYINKQTIFPNNENINFKNN